ncbi:MAG: Rrf2 family transcriptional regulator [Planctomycetota bacterium]
MSISARVHYATLAMLELALRVDDPTPISASEITEKHQIPGPFLLQIMRTLRARGWVESIRGSQGGYRLRVDADSITLLDITEAIGCQENQSMSGPGATAECQRLQVLWDSAAEASRSVLEKARLSDIAEQVRGGDSAMFYI